MLSSDQQNNEASGKLDSKPEVKPGSIPWAALILFGSVALALAAYQGGTISARKDEVKIEFPAPGTTLVKVNDRPDKASYLLAASNLWSNTGLILEPKQTVKVTASGRANLAIHRLVEAAHADTRPLGGWMGPEGLQPGTHEVKDNYRQDLKIEPLASDGTLLAYLHKNGSPIPSQDNPLRGKTTIVAASGEVKNDTDGPLTLWLVINDAVLENTQESKLAFLKVESENDRRIHNRPKGYRNYNPEEPDSWTPLDHWKYIQKRQYWNLWFDDNVGFYQVQVVFNPQPKH